MEYTLQKNLPSTENTVLPFAKLKAKPLSCARLCYISWQLSLSACTSGTAKATVVQTPPLNLQLSRSSGPSFQGKRRLVRDHDHKSEHQSLLRIAKRHQRATQASLNAALFSPGAPRRDLSHTLSGLQRAVLQVPLQKNSTAKAPTMKFSSSALILHSSEST